MIKLLIKDWSKDEKICLRDSLLIAYTNASKAWPQSSDDFQKVTKAYANAISWLEDDIAKM